MTMNKLLAAALLCAATVAQAQSSRFYGAADYGTVSYSGPGTYSSPGALSAAAGYRYLNNVNLEAGLTLVGDATGNIPGTGRVNISQSIISATVLGLVPLNQQVNLFGKAGVGVHNGEPNGLPDDLIYGFGVHVAVARNVQIRVQYESLGRAKVPSTSSKADMTRLAVGATLDF